ncbi:MAG: hypothetical protein M1820_002809 [Bogoriella megaspora]|nr:MAG: hypothetical protein M1820_002809 [Bogoriella megaspora]
MYLSQRWPMFIGLACLGLIFFFSFSDHTTSLRSKFSTHQTAQGPLNVGTPGLDWEFDTDRDGINLGLTDEQCSAAFPRLYAEIDRAYEFHKSRGIQREQIVLDPVAFHAQAHCMIYNGQLYIIEEKLRPYDHRPFRDPRVFAAVASVYRSMAALPDPRILPNIEFIINVADDPGEPDPNVRVCWGFSRDKEDNSTWIMPDHGGWSPFDVVGVGSYNIFRDEVKRNEKPFEEKIPKAVYRGTASLNEMRERLVQISNGTTWGDAQHTNKQNHVTTHKFCDWQYLFHVEGRSWSGRLRYLANCESVLIIPPLNYIAHFYPLLEAEGENQNHVQVNPDWSTLDDTMMYWTSHPKEAAAIAAESARTFRDRYLTPAAEACYYRRMFTTWRAVQNFEPELFHEVVNKHGILEKQIRGKGYEEWSLPAVNFC